MLRCPICGAKDFACTGEDHREPFMIIDLIPSSNPKTMWRSPERLYLNSKGEPVPDGDPDVQTLLVAKGCEIPLAQAKRLGLAKESEPESSPEAVAIQAELDRPENQPNVTEVVGSELGEVVSGGDTEAATITPAKPDKPKSAKVRGAKK